MDNPTGHKPQGVASRGSAQRLVPILTRVRTIATDETTITERVLPRDTYPVTSSVVTTWMNSPCPSATLSTASGASRLEPWRR
jgi:hypothetical protein